MSTRRDDSNTDRAHLAMRIAWLRVQGHRMLEVDPSGLLSAQLWDFADLLEVLDKEGWWDAR